MSRIRTALVGTVAAGLLLMSVSVAHADNLHQDDLVAIPANHTVAVGEIDATKYWLNPTNAQVDGQQGCNASDGSPANVTIVAPANVTVTGSPFQLTQCGVDNFKTVNFSSNTPGDYLITASVSDSGSADPDAYREQPASFTLHVEGPIVPPVEEDVTPPVIVANDMIVQGNTTGGANVPAYDVTVTDEDPNPTVTFSPAANSFFALGGPHTVSITAKDADNNTATASFTVTVIDTIDPVLHNVPGNVTRYGWNGFFQPIDNGGVVNRVKAGQSIPVKFNLDGPATATWVNPTATDIVDANPTVVCDYASGSVFQQGTTTVTCTATDDSGNEAQGSFNVTVLGGDLGTSIMYPDYPSFVYGSVPPVTPADDIEVTTTSTPGLHYDAVAKQYVYVWATSKAWAGKSGTLQVKLSDGSMHTALFNFQK